MEKMARILPTGDTWHNTDHCHTKPILTESGNQHESEFYGGNDGQCALLSNIKLFGSIAVNAKLYADGDGQ